MLSTTQLPLFLLAPKTRQNAGEQALLLMAYSGTKLDRDARAIDLYRGVMYASYRAHVRSEAAPRVLILSARHGFLQPDSEIAPYDERMTRQRADQTLADLPRYLQPAAWPSRVGLVLSLVAPSIGVSCAPRWPTGTAPRCLLHRKPVVASACSGRNSAPSSTD